MRYPEYWNHNAAYYDWIKDSTADCNTILDVGCGDGSLIHYLDDGNRVLVGIDADEKCISNALAEVHSDNAQFICDRFEKCDFTKKFDAIIFVASIHHMDMKEALIKAKSELNPDGVILIVGLARPSDLRDWLIELFRVVPCAVISKMRDMQPSERNNIPVSYQFQKMKEIRDTAYALLPSFKIKYGLFYRYLLWWKSDSDIKSAGYNPAHNIYPKRQHIPQRRTLKYKKWSRKKQE